MKRTKLLFAKSHHKLLQINLLFYFENVQIVGISDIPALQVYDWETWKLFIPQNIEDPPIHENACARNIICTTRPPVRWPIDRGVGFPSKAFAGDIMIRHIHHHHPPCIGKKQGQYCSLLHGGNLVWFAAATYVRSRSLEHFSCSKRVWHLSRHFLINTPTQRLMMELFVCFLLVCLCLLNKSYGVFWRKRWPTDKKCTKPD